MAESVERITAVCRLAPRRPEAHKGDFGRVLIVGGSRGMIGAVALASNAALRGGAGLVIFAAPETIQLQVAVLCPCATSVPLACNAAGELAKGSVAQMLEKAADCDVLAIGPGMAVGPGQERLLLAALEQKKPLIIDADGLNNLAAIDGWSGLGGCSLVLTPHPGEFARLTGRSVKEIQADREGAALAAVRGWRKRAGDRRDLVCVLKGAGTVVTDGRRVYRNATGNPGMASGGSGDVLTGLTAALMGQGLAPFEAACLAVHCHGRAGDLAAQAIGQVSLMATDLLDYLPAAMKEVSAQSPLCGPVP
jgi:NAD(P)H-hydrate epimerase